MPGISFARFASAIMMAAIAGVIAMVLIVTGMTMAIGGAVAIVGLPLILFFGMVFGLPIALGHILILGVPAWLLINLWRPPGWIGTAAIGLVIGAAPITIYGIAAPPANPLTQLGFGAAFGAAGVAAALAFLRTLRRRTDD